SKWDAYSEAIDEMFEKTSTSIAPWHLIPANHKRYARVTAIRKVVAALAKDVDLNPQHLDRKTLDAANKHLDVEQELIDSLRARTE
ncbi:hypothetical protein AB9K41_07750, partial [Cribrihabitans sp. XS_ASV171]